MHADERAKAKRAFDVCTVAAEYAPVAIKAWLRRLRDVGAHEIDGAIGRMPADVMTPLSRAFTAQLLKLNRARLLALPIGDIE